MPTVVAENSQRKANYEWPDEANSPEAHKVAAHFYWSNLNSLSFSWKGFCFEKILIRRSLLLKILTLNRPLFTQTLV
jgi:hypothetical protein